MISAPSVMSGRSRRTWAQNSIASCARMPALHPLQNHVVAGLQRQMQMRHQPLVIGDDVEQIAIGLDGIDRRNPQPLQFRHVPQNLFCQLPEFRRARQVGAVAREIDARQHDLGMAALGQRADLFDDRAHRHRARIAAAVRDDAEGAAVVAAVLHLHEHPRQAGLETVEQMRRHLLDRHDVGDRDLLACLDTKARIERRARVAPGLAAHLVVIADDAIDLGHFGKHFRLRLRRAAGDDDAQRPAARASAAGSIAAPAPPPRW